MLKKMKMNRRKADVYAHEKSPLIPNERYMHLWQQRVLQGRMLLRRWL
jgi:hypothetical protein